MKCMEKMFPCDYCIHRNVVCLPTFSLEPWEINSVTGFEKKYRFFSTEQFFVSWTHGGLSLGESEDLAWRE